MRSWRLYLCVILRCVPSPWYNAWWLRNIHRKKGVWEKVAGMLWCPSPSLQPGDKTKDTLRHPWNSWLQFPKPRVALPRATRRTWASASTP